VTITQATADWLRVNQAALSAEIRQVRTELAGYAGQPTEESAEPGSPVIGALDVAAERLGLSSFVRGDGAGGELRRVVRARAS